jgi:hypothetical protein
MAIEHRYYGKSLPFNDLNNQNLEYLSSQQAMQDIKLFLDFLY